MDHVGRAVLLMCIFALIFVVGMEPITGPLRARPSRQTTAPDTVSFAQDVFPIFKRHCLPCHAEDNYNPSELSLDSYELLMEGGRHGDAVIPGNSKESKLVLKLLADPPFGDRMPLDMRKKKAKKPTVAPLHEDEIQTIATWISQGAKNN